MKAQKYKTIKHYHEPGDLHELTFSCYHQRKLLTNDAWRGYLAREIDDAGGRLRFDLVAFVFMPEHVHLLVYPHDDEPAIDGFLASIKQPVSAQVKRDLRAAGSPLVARLTIRERPGKQSFRFWQEGPGYDRNLHQPESVKASIDYLHLNPVRRNLVTEARRWRWSSARFYESEGQIVDPDLPRITPLPAEFWTK